MAWAVGAAFGGIRVCEAVYQRWSTVKLCRRDCLKLVGFVNRIEGFLHVVTEGLQEGAQLPPQDLRAFVLGDPHVDATFKALLEALTDVVEVFDSLVCTSWLRAIIRAEELHRRLTGTAQRLSLAMEMFMHVYALLTSEARAAEVGRLQAELAEATFSTARAIAEQAAYLADMNANNERHHARTHAMLDEVRGMLQPGASGDMHELLDAALQRSEDQELQELQYVALLAQAWEQAEQPPAPSAPPAPPAPPAVAEPEVEKRLVCPITQELFVDPVLLVEAGITYERHAIVAWLASHDTDPVTRTRLVSKALVPNVVVRQLASELRESGAPRPARPARAAAASRPAARDAAPASAQRAAAHDQGRKDTPWWRRLLARPSSS